ncbi:hypothetical protein TSUD_60730 [Trifolium subterraneum]|uniref:Reverse transcriptase zinc-binding domain-containing protein n=1 Tax=Trifolium subterraneum TaxID=3900 RepID=A0A2Z6NVG0_TRISU|nr:hypothetical protein TSUD_60730 [Trifolium subterraneum]
MFSLGWGSDGEAWQWRRQHSFLTDGSGSSILIKATLFGGAYQLLTPQVTATMDEVEKLIWHSQVPLKVSSFAWRLLRDRLPTKENLVAQGILSPKVHFCTSGCGEIESAHHLFISCNTFGSLWTLVRSWIGIRSVDSISVQDHFVRFTSSAGGSRARRSFLQLIWLAFGLFGQKEITDYSEVQQTTLSYCWIRSSFFHSDG